MPDQNLAEDVPRSDETLAVIGNCQAQSMALSLRTITGLPTDSYPLGVLKSSSVSEQTAVVEKLKSYAHVFVQDHEKPDLGLLTYSNLARVLPRHTVYPAVVFHAFHPDCCYVQVSGGSLISPIGRYHSALTVACYLEQIPHSRVPDLFNRYFFRLFDFFDRYDDDLAALARLGASHDYDLAEVVRQCAESQSFMHTFNHPKIDFMLSLARQAAAKAGLASSGGTQAVEEMLDPLSQKPAWPVYPLIAEELDLDHQAAACFELRRSSEARPSISLSEFVKRSFRIYKKVEGELRVPPVVSRIRRILRDTDVR